MHLYREIFLNFKEAFMDKKIYDYVIQNGPVSMSLIGCYTGYQHNILEKKIREMINEGVLEERKGLYLAISL